MKLYMLDTDTSSYIIRNRPESIRAKFDALQPEQIFISVITFAEQLYDVEYSSSSRINQAIVEDFARHLVVKPWDEKATIDRTQLAAGVSG